MMWDYPPILHGRAEEQAAQLRAYLVRLVRTLEERFSSTSEKTGSGTDDAWKTSIENAIGGLRKKATQTGELYAVGDIFTTTRSGNPSTLLGYGTWVQIKDRFLLAAGDTYTAGDTGGEASHTLTVDEMPAHTHKDDITNAVSTANDGYMMSGGYTVARSGAAIGGSVGGGQAHNNMPPYLVVYMWLRTA